MGAEGQGAHQARSNMIGDPLWLWRVGAVSDGCCGCERTPLLNSLTSYFDGLQKTDNMIHG
jgi:hypothetical protein